MKKHAFVLPLVLGLTASAYAGDSYSAKSSKEVIPPPPSCHLQWFLGASGGYLTDAEEEMYHLQFGVEKVCPDRSCTHALYLELGYTELDESYAFDFTDSIIDIDMDTEIIPLTLNYKYECNLTGNLNWYIGAGAGIAFVDTDLSAEGQSEGFDDEVFYAQGFAGLVYNFSESFEIFGGARYIYMDDPDLTGLSEFDDDASIDGDVLVELGVRFNF
ncbi:Opacity protein [Rubritalea squalenifaciens DSM 18772]|uniref:Opacity protein n=2 Tax=Rubritalea TaxID=361050 RepID=A0A1M6B4T8_9BACT|nr:outer membrane beta-barrel protein [Rubritalea squalenifaciens]SHI43716.1 Opacity protein [Rubritalea squalenifaciens DSM 18772]